MKDFLCLQRPFLDLGSQTPRPRGRGRPLLADFIPYSLFYVLACVVCVRKRKSRGNRIEPVNGESCCSNHALVKAVFEVPKCL